MVSLKSIAQFTLDGVFRPRTEYRHGYGNLIPRSEEPGYGIATRVRLNAAYQNDFYKFYMSLQDVIVWGENRQLKPEDENNSLTIFEAWADLKIAKKISAKIGRQKISYDNERILGGVDWVQQARNHDALVFKYEDDHAFSFDIGLAFNQDHENISGFNSVGNGYVTTGFFSYKTMQYVYLNKKWETFSASFLVLNNGFQNFNEAEEENGISNLQTTGIHLNYKKSKIGIKGDLFIQTGARQGALDVKRAFLTGLDIDYQVSEKVTISTGAEIISGNDQNTTNQTNAFFPLYGTNHKFNGLMDYFYVGNHANSIGLIDVHVSTRIKFDKGYEMGVTILNFYGEQSIQNGEKLLGTEMDFVCSKKFKNFTLKGGYSQMFESDGINVLKGINEVAASSTQNWAWLMLILKPKFIN